MNWCDCALLNLQPASDLSLETGAQEDGIQQLSQKVLNRAT